MKNNVVDCAVCNTAIHVADKGAYYVLAATDGSRPYDLICQEHDFTEVINEIHLVDPRLYEVDEMELGSFEDDGDRLR